MGHVHSGERIISDEVAAQLKSRFDAEMMRPVELVLIKGLKNEEYTRWTEQMLNELSELTNLIKVRVHDIRMEPEVVEKYNVSRTPTVLIDPDAGYKIRYTGAPTGYEAWAFVETIILVSRDESQLGLKTREILKAASDSNREAHVMIFVTPTCPYCPHQVLLANKFAIELKGIVEADCVEAYENPDLADIYGVSAVPHNVIALKGNDKEEVKDVTIGVQQEEDYALRLVKALKG